MAALDITQVSSPGRLLWVDLRCHQGPGFTEARDRYKAHFWTYEMFEGLTMLLNKVNMHENMAHPPSGSEDEEDDESSSETGDI